MEKPNQTVAEPLGVPPQTLGHDADRSSKLKSSPNRFLSLVKQEFIKRAGPIGEPLGYFTVPVRYSGSSYDLPLIYFVNRGCTYDRAGACIECNFGRGPRVPDDELVARLTKVINQFQGRPAIYLTPSGSMFDDAEVPEAVRLSIFRQIHALGFESVSTESRPEFLTEDKVRQVVNILGKSVEFEIGVGLESSNDWVRRNCINKMLSLDIVDESIERCHRAGAMVYAHILIKAPFLDEVEAIEDAINTATWAFEHGVDRIGFALTNVKPGTVTQWLAQRGLYRPPYYWSVLQILLSLRSELLERTGLFGFDSGVPIEQHASNCPACSLHIRSMLQAWCWTKDTKFLHQADQYPCRCKSAWLEDLRRPRSPLPHRVAWYYEELGRNILGDDWWETHGGSIIDELQEE